MTDETTTPWPEGIISADHAGVRAFWIATDSMQDLVDRLALTLGEHMAEDDDLHVNYNGMLGGWQEHPGHNANFFRSAKAPWTQLEFEYSAFVILRGHRPLAASDE